MKYGFRSMTLIAALLLFGCAKEVEDMDGERQEPDNSLMRVITGEVWYRERIALPAGAEVRVVLEDQSRADAPATEITTYTHIVDGAPPYPFRLVYAPDAIDDRARYGLRARIEHGGELLFTSTEHVDPFAAEAGTPVRIRVDSARR